MPEYSARGDALHDRLEFTRIDDRATQARDNASTTVDHEERTRTRLQANRPDQGVGLRALLQGEFAGDRLDAQLG